MTLFITYKQQVKDLTFGFDQSDSTSSLSKNECRISLQKLVDIFKIECNGPETLLSEYPNAKLHGLPLGTGDDDDDLVVISLNDEGYFLCKLNSKYELYSGKRIAVQPTSIQEQCHFSKLDIEMAAILSDAVYYSDPIKHINEHYTSYSCFSTLTPNGCGLKFAAEASTPYLFAISRKDDDEETLWVAFRGTTNMNDILTDLTINPTLTSSGMVHRGFSKRASELPYATLMNEFNNNRNYPKRLIFTGHSLGGSVAHLCTIFNLANKSYKENPKLYSIAFGSPFIGDRTVAEDLIRKNFNNNFLTIINQSDIVPNLLNLVETGSRVQSTAVPFAQQCSEIVTTLLPLISSVTGVSSEVLTLPIRTLNSLVPKLKQLLNNKITDYKPIGQYGFIRSLMSFDDSNNQDLYDWIITFKSNCMKIDRETNAEKFIDVISKKLIESFGPSTATITNTNIINHFMEKYISSLKSCEFINSQLSTSRRTNQRVTEFTCFDLYIQKATAICSHTDIKVIITGDHLDFVSSHEKMCLITSENFFQPNSIMTISEMSRNKLVLMNDSLLPVEKRVTIGPRKYQLATHFGKINLMLELHDDDIGQEATFTFQKFDTNFLMAAFLRSFFECLHTKDCLFLPTTKDSSWYFAKLFANRLPSKFQQFKTLAEKHFNACQQMKKVNKPISIDGKLYNDMSSLLNDLYKALTEMPEYAYTESFIQRAKKSPGRYLIATAGALAGTYVLFHVGLFSLLGYPLFSGTALHATLAEFGALQSGITGLGTLGSYTYLAKVSHNSLDRLVYHERLAFLLNSMGSNSDNCANENMLEIQICNILEDKSINFDDIDMKDRKTIEKILKDTHLFDANEITNGNRPTLYGATMDSQIKAFEFLYDIYCICKLRRSMTAQYISFIGAHRAGKSSLLKSLWNIPTQRGDYLDNRTQQMQIYTVYDNKSSNKVHLIDYPGVTDPVKTIAHLNQNYAVFSTFYVIVVRAGTDYKSAAELIRELQTTSTIVSSSDTNNQVAEGLATTQPKLANDSIYEQDREQLKYGLNKSAKFVIIITGIDTIPDSLIQNELDEAINKRLNIPKDLICLCYNKESIADENYLRLHESRNLPGVAEVRQFLNKHFNQILNKNSDFNTYKYQEQ
ncbi:unnamed protein product [Rotaria sp. Silwood2]|nr:unnamed protein product [Rotaria sp. Silwood2]